MALANTGVIEVRTTGGNDANGGGFNSAAAGTDFSQQTSSQQNFNGTTLSATTAGVGSVLTLVGVSSAASWVGNYLNIISGTNYTVGVYEITAQSGTTITLDRNATTGAGSAMAGNMGGCFQTISKALSIMTVTGMQTYVKATATYSISSTLSTTAGVSLSAGICRLIGYTTTRGDGGRPTIQTTAAVAAFTDSVGAFRFENFTLDGNSTGTVGLASTGNSSVLFNCIVKNFTSHGVSMTGGSTLGVVQNEITANVGRGVNCAGTTPYIVNNYIHANTAAGVFLNANPPIMVEGNIIASNTGASSDGITTNFLCGSIRRNIIYNNGRDGIRNTANYEMYGEISNNIIVNNAGFGLNTSVMSPVVNEILMHHNAYYNNTSGSRSGNNAGTGDITLTGVPFNNVGSDDFSLNNTVGQGADCRKAGFPGVLSAGGTGYADMGALQSPAPVFVHPGMNGGMRG